MMGRRVRLVAVMVALLGAVVMWNSTDWGDKAAREYMGPGAWTTHPEKQAGYMSSLRLMGAVMLGVGLLRALEPGREEQR